MGPGLSCFSAPCPAFWRWVISAVQPHSHTHWQNTQRQVIPMKPCTSSPFAVWLIAIVAFQHVHAFSPLPVLQDWLTTCPTHQLCFPTLPGLHFQSFPLHLHKTTFYNTFPIVFECLSFLVYEHSWCVSGRWFTFHYSVKLAELVI